MIIKKQKTYLVYIASLCAILLFSMFTGCENKDDVSSVDISVGLEVNTNLIKLVDDSTRISGTIQIATDISAVDLRWNLPTISNIDTTLTSIKVENGICNLPVEWIDKQESGTYGPSSKAFSGGVLISAGDLSRYVHLVWADRIDSTKIVETSEVLTRSGNLLPRIITLELLPELVKMDAVVGGGVYVNYTDAPIVAIDQTAISESTNINKKKIPVFLNEPGSVSLEWVVAPPNNNFSTQLTFDVPGITKIVNVVYVVPNEEPAIWEFIDATPSEGNTILANEAKIVVQVKTNKPWSLECDKGLTSPVSDFGTALENRSLVMHLSNNTSADSRAITVLVKSQGVLQKTLTFNQMGQGQTGVFDFLRSAPVDKSTLPGENTSVNVTVQSDVAWWIKCDCGKRMDYPASALGEKSGTVAITENNTGAPRVVTVTVGYGDTTVKTLSFVQNVSGAIDPSATLVYDSSTLPTGNILKDGGNYTFTFTGTYTGGVQVRALIDGIAQAPGASVTNKQPQTSVPANTLTTTRNITFQYKREDGDWTALLTTTNRVQDGNGGGGETQTLSYVSSTLPTGNIPQAGSVYTFNFEGGYAGQLRVRLVDDTGAVLFNGPVGTTHSPKMTVPANTATTARNLKFQYRLIDITGSAWLNLPATTNRIQDAIGDGGIPGNITAGKILPPGDVPENGRSYYCVFKGTGKVIFRALRNRTEVSRSPEGTATATGVNLGVTIPSLGTNKSSTISFEYSTDGGNTWINMNDDRAQKQTYVVVEPSTVQEFPARNASGSFGIRGTTSQIVTIYAYSGGLQIGKASTSPVEEGVMLNVPIQDNPGPGTRLVSFSWTLDGENWISTPPVKQLAP